MAILFARKGSTTGPSSTRPTSIPRRWPRRSRHLRARPDPQVHREPPEVGRQILALGLLHRCLWPRRVRQEPARAVVFSDHSLVTDAVFAEMHLISCRNVMIYFDRAAGSRHRPVPGVPGPQGLSGTGLQGESCASPATRRRSTTSSPARRSTRGASHDRDADEGGGDRGLGGRGAGAVTILPALPASFPLPVLVVVHVPADRSNVLVAAVPGQVPGHGQGSRGQGTDRSSGVDLFRAVGLSPAGRDGRMPGPVDRRAGLLFAPLDRRFVRKRGRRLWRGAGRRHPDRRQPRRRRRAQGRGRRGGVAIVENPDGAYASPCPTRRSSYALGAIMNLDAIANLSVESGDRMTSGRDRSTSCWSTTSKRTRSRWKPCCKRDGLTCLKARSGEEALELLLGTTSRWRCSTCRCRNERLRTGRVHARQRTRTGISRSSS
jgi:hypothetical protein